MWNIPPLILNYQIKYTYLSNNTAPLFAPLCPLRLCGSTPKWLGYNNSINDCNTSLGKDAIHRVSTNSLFVALFFQIGINAL
ncbi:hypothetical protein [Nostoc sp.]|uniref:hypothetical protein n=1 Tax=Nostoc sp. TaxID=1180 RepID=UPI0026CFCA3F